MKGKFKMPEKAYDFSGWASRYNVKCSDGRTIRDGAFKDMDGMVVPLVWGHDHESPLAVLGSALIKHKDEGPYIYGSFNESAEGQHAKEAVRHGDVKYLSIYANKLKQQPGGNVLHGVIREVSLVYGGANPGAFIDNAVIAHSDGSFDTIDDEAIIFTGDEILIHADSDEADGKENGEGAKDMADEKKKKDDDKTVGDVLETLNEEQLTAVQYVIEQAVLNATKGKGADDDKDDDEATHSDDEGDEDTMKYNAFENDDRRQPNYISHADQEEILKLAKDTRVGTWKNAIAAYAEENDLQHDDTSMGVGGFDDVTKIDNVYTSFTAMRSPSITISGAKRYLQDRELRKFSLVFCTILERLTKKRKSR